MCSMKQNGYRITKTATITPVIKRTQVPTATPTVARKHLQRMWELHHKLDK